MVLRWVYLLITPQLNNRPDHRFKQISFRNQAKTDLCWVTDDWVQLLQPLIRPIRLSHYWLWVAFTIGIRRGGDYTSTASKLFTFTGSYRLGVTIKTGISRMSHLRFWLSLPALSSQACIGIQLQLDRPFCPGTMHILVIGLHRCHFYQ